MKHLRLFLIILIVATMLSGCDPERRYMGEHQDLIATAIYSIPGIDSNWADDVQILEQDSFGRTLYAVRMSDSLLIRDSWENYALAILIMQKSEEGSAYFYPENNYLLCVASRYVDLNEQIIEDYFNEEDILALKNRNDWNHPYREDTSDMLCVPITNDKYKRMPVVSDKVIESKIGSNYRYTFFREDTNGNNIYFITNITEASKECYLIAFNKEGTLIDEQKSILQINRYKPDEMPLAVQNFLYSNGWDG